MSALRQEMLKKWLTSLNGFEFDLQTLQAASSDASFRRYFRVTEGNNARTLIVMDAPPDKEDVRPFVHVAALLRQGGSKAPDVLAQNPEDGFLLLQDFGNTTMLQALKAQPDRKDAFYMQALHDLVHLQANTACTGLPAYGAEKLLQEMCTRRRTTLVFRP